MAAAFCRIEEYQQGQDWAEYIERLEFYFTANDIGEDKDKDLVKRQSILLTVCGSQTYSLVRNLCARKIPKDKTYAELKDLVKDHLCPKPIVIAERFKFLQRNQKDSESVSDFLTALKKLSESCKFEAFLDESLRDRFVCGLKSVPIQTKLLTEKDLTWQRAFEMASGMEAAKKQADELNQMKQTGATVKNLKPSNGNGSCFRCGKSGHTPDRCYYKNATCHNCQKVGHLSRKCKQDKPSGEEKGDSKPKPKWMAGKMKKKSSKVKHLDNDCDAQGASENENEWPVFSLK